MEVQPPEICGIRRLARVCLYLVLAFGPLASLARAESGYDAWLRYPRVDEKTAAERYAEFPAIVVALGDSERVASARDELVRGMRGMLGQTLRIESKLPAEDVVLLGTFEEVKKAVPTLEKLPELAADGFCLKSIQFEGRNCLLIAAPNDRGVLYGTFAVLRKIALGQSIAKLNEQHSPAAPLRVLNHRDRLDGAMERAYAGGSIFWEAGHIAKDLNRVRDYGRLVASVGINGLSINHPSSGQRLMTEEYVKELARVADVLRPFGVQLYIALNSATPPGSTDRQGSQDDEANSSSAWNKQVESIFKAIPDLGGFVIHADWGSMEHVAEHGPAQAEAINVIAAAVEPHGGVVFCRTCRCGVETAPNDPKLDPAKAAYDTFHPLDGKFADNVVLQVKNGPMDFQVREPPSPLFGGLKKTNQAIELEMTQQYLGQQRHLCFLVPMWKDVLEFDMHAKEKGTPVKDLVCGKTFERPIGGFVAIANAGRANNWLGHDLALANLYGFGRLAWDPDLTNKAIAEEWTRLTFGQDPLLVGALVDMLLKSWRIYESYTGPLGAGSLTDIGEVQYGPSIESGGQSGWAPWLNADATGLGKDRTAATGTGFIAQYHPAVAERFQSLETCPDALLLFMHRVPYTHPLDSGKTVIQHVYDMHYQGASDVARFAEQWQSLKGRIDDERYEAVLARLQYQAGHARVWRDAVCTWFLHKSGIADNEGRVGNYPNRFEAEVLEREGYDPHNVTPWETASGGQAAQCVDPSGKGAVSLKYDGKAGWFNIGIAYFDENDGASQYKLLVAGQVVDEWTADDLLPDNKPNGHTSTRRQTSRIALRPGDLIRVEATAEGGERAAIDYLEIEPAGK